MSSEFDGVVEVLVCVMERIRRSGRVMSCHDDDESEKITESYVHRRVNKGVE